MACKQGHKIHYETCSKTTNASPSILINHQCMLQFPILAHSAQAHSPCVGLIHSQHFQQHATVQEPHHNLNSTHLLIFWRHIGLVKLVPVIWSLITTILFNTWDVKVLAIKTSSVSMEWETGDWSKSERY